MGDIEVYDDDINELTETLSKDKDDPKSKSKTSKLPSTDSLSSLKNSSSNRNIVPNVTSAKRRQKLASATDRQFMRMKPGRKDGSIEELEIDIGSDEPIFKSFDQSGAQRGGYGNSYQQMPSTRDDYRYDNPANSRRSRATSGAMREAMPVNHYNGISRQPKQGPEALESDRSFIIESC